MVEGLIDHAGQIDAHFTGLQKSPTGAAYRYLPVPYEIPGFANARLENRLICSGAARSADKFRSARRSGADYAAAPRAAPNATGQPSDRLGPPAGRYGGRAAMAVSLWRGSGRCR
jgi:hypothetical protein